MVFSRSFSHIIMKSFIVVFCLLGAAVAQSSYYYQPKQTYRQVQPVLYSQPSVKYVQPVLRPVSPVDARIKPVAILSQTSSFNYDGNFNYDFQAENGITSQATGSVKEISPKEQAQVMQGSYSYTAPDGTPITATWYADETGFHVEGEHIPKPPAIPEAIARSLEYIRSLPPSKYDQQ